MTEYGIGRRGDDPGDLHRGPMTREQAQDWIESAIADGIREDAFFIVKRYVGDWHVGS